jgi:mannose-6-phosphate isomerase-like protein (cupin superfamily)
MKYIPKASAQKFENSSTCTVFEYGGDSDLDGAVAIISGRYPESGWGMNTVSKEMVYVISGTGSLTTKEGMSPLAEGDVVLINNNEPYYFEGAKLRIFMPTTPAWNPEQYAYLT